MLKKVKNDVLVNGKINCRKLVNINVVFPVFNYANIIRIIFNIIIHVNLTNLYWQKHYIGVLFNCTIWYSTINMRCNMFEIIIYILLILSLIYGFYFLIMASGVFKKKKCEIDNNKKNHFAILIAARNEETVIKNLINSLKK